MSVVRVNFFSSVWVLNVVPDIWSWDWDSLWAFSLKENSLMRPPDRVNFYLEFPVREKEEQT